MKTFRSLTAWLLVAMLTVGLLIPVSASSLLSGASNGATLEAGHAGSIPFTISYPAATPVWPGAGYPGLGSGVMLPGYGVGYTTGVISQVVATLDVGSAPMSVVGQNSMQFGQILRGSDVQGSFTVSVPADTKPGSFTARINVDYNFYPFVADSTDPANPFAGSLSDTPQPGSLTIDVPVTIVNAEYAALSAKDVFAITRRDIPEFVLPGDAFSIGVTVRNTTEYRLEDVTVSLDAPHCYFVDDTGIKTLSIMPRLSARASYALKVAPDAPAGSHQVQATVSYVNPSGETVSQTFYMVLNIKEKPVEEKPAVLPADVKITAFTLPAELNAGEVFSATVTVQNMSADRAAESLTLALTQESGLHVRSASKLTVPTLAPGESATLTVDYASAADAPSAYCLFTATYTYTTKDVEGSETRAQDNGTYLREREKPSLTLTDVKIPTSVMAKTDFTLSVTLQNNGGDAENLFFSIEPDAGFVYKSSTTHLIKSLARGESTTLTFKLFGGETITEGYKSIRLSCMAEGENLLTDYTGVNMIVPVKEEEKEEEPVTDVPVLIISSYDYGREVFGGQTFTLSLTFRNTSRTTAVKDLKVTISSAMTDTGTAFTPANSSNTFFIEKLEPEETVTQTIDLLVKNDITPKSYGVDIDIQYKNPSNISASANETLAIPVKQEVRFNVGEISSLTDITTMEEAYLTATFGNLGKSMIYNVIVKVAGEGFSCYAPEYYAGNIEAGKHLTYDFYLTPNGPGFATGTITYSYEDANGEQFSEVQDFSFNINDADMGGDIGMMPGVIEPGFSEPIVDEATGYIYDEMTGQWMDPMTGEIVDDPTAGGDTLLGVQMWIWCAAGGALVLIGAVIAIVCIVRARKKRQEDEDADL